MSDKSNIIICRCEDITLQQIDEAIEQGFTTFEDLKRILRVGMGPCQANTCGHLIQNYLSQKLGVSIEAVKTHKVRPPLIGITLDDIVAGSEK